jgi:hypothetical protein
MQYFTRPMSRSIVDTVMAARVPDPAAAGISEIAAIDPVAAERVVINHIDHVWLREPGETERDFLAMALAAARSLGVKAVTFAGTAPVPPPEETTR